MWKVLLVSALVSQPVCGLKVRAGMWGPADLNDVENALKHILMIHMQPSQKQFAEKVATDVRADIAEIATNKSLTKAERQTKVKSAIGELSQLYQAMQHVEENAIKVNANMTSKDMQSKVAMLKEKLKKKQAELAMEEKELKLFKLKKLLAEKQLQLANLKDEQEASAQSKKEVQADAAAREGLIKEMEAVLTNATTMKNHAALSTALNARKQSLSDALAKLDAMEKKSEETLDKALSQNQVGNDLMNEGQKMIKKLKKETHRKFAKGRASKKAELAVVSNAIQSVEKADVVGARAALGKLKEESKMMDAKSGNFLYF